MVRYPVLTLVSLSTCGVVAATMVLFLGPLWLAIVLYVATVLAVVGLVSFWLR